MKEEEEEEEKKKEMTLSLRVLPYDSLEKTVKEVSRKEWLQQHDTQTALLLFEREGQYKE